MLIDLKNLFCTANGNGALKVKSLGNNVWEVRHLSLYVNIYNLLVLTDSVFLRLDPDLS
jgi:hypothetical protein